MAGFARNITGLDAFAVEEMEHEIAHLVVADRRQQRRAQAEASGADAYIRRAAADIGVKAGHLGHGDADLMGIQVDRAAAHGQNIVDWLSHMSLHITMGSNW